MTTAAVCVAGATGYLGRRVVAELRARSLPVVAIARRRSDKPILRQLSGLGATLAYVDASLKEPYSIVLVGVQTAITCLAASNAKGSSTDDFWTIDRDANIRFCLDAILAGATQVILVATFEGRASRHLTAFSEAKEQAVDEVRKACRDAHVAFTVIRPTAYFSDLTDRAFEGVLKTGRHTVIGDGSHRLNPIAGEDVASTIADCVELPERAGKEYPIGGPDIFTFCGIGELAAEVIGTQASLSIKQVPLGRLRLMALSASIAGTVSRRARRLSALLKWMIYSSTHDAVAPASGKRRLRDEFLDKLRKAEASAQPV